MKRCTQVGLCALVAGVLTASGASAATIQQVLADDFDPTQENYVDYFGGTAPKAFMLTWEPDPANQNEAPSGHRPSGAPEYGPAAGNPDWLKFNYLGGGGGGGGGGGAGANTLSTFTLGNNRGNAWSMDFYVLIFDAGFAGAEINVYLIGEDLTKTDNSKKATVDQADVKNGKMLKFTITEAVAKEEVTVHIESVGDESYAAGFFMDNEVVGMAIPEPATLALLGLGAAGVAARRRRRR